MDELDKRKDPIYWAHLRQKMKYHLQKGPWVLLTGIFLACLVVPTKNCSLLHELFINSVLRPLLWVANVPCLSLSLPPLSLSYRFEPVLYLMSSTMFVLVSLFNILLYINICGMRSANILNIPLLHESLSHWYSIV